MKRICEKVRCVRRFALFPVKLWDGKRNAYLLVWLEFYYIIQSRGSVYEWWVNDRLADKETWQRWRADDATD